MANDGKLGLVEGRERVSSCILQYLLQVSFLSHRVFCDVKMVR